MDPRARSIQHLFSRISQPYDCLNHVFSLGIDLWWRHHFVSRLVQPVPGERILDLATGSGDVAVALARRGACVVGVDFCLPMLNRARTKGVARLVAADGLHLPFGDKTFDAVTIAFGFRNFTDRPRGLREMLRVLRPGGRLAILEFSQPRRWLRPFYRFYLEQVMPRATALLAGERSAYEHLGNTVREFPDQTALAEMIRAEGFEDVKWRDYTFGIAAAHLAWRPLSEGSLVSPQPPREKVQSCPHAPSAG